MGYIVMTSGINGMNLFLVDRRKIKNKWWSYDAGEAMLFQKLSAANIQAGKLRYKSPTVITYEEAVRLSNENDMREVDSVHPFSGDAFA